MPDYIHAFTPSDDAVEPSQVRITALSAEPINASQKVRVKIELTPFTALPDINFTIQDENGNEISSTNMIESVLDQINFVMHLRKAPDDVIGNYSLIAEVIYRNIGKVHEKSIKFSIT
jgi:hypothetical protein